MEHRYYSIRMLADRGGCHLSGAERLVMGEGVEPAIVDMWRRGEGHHPDSMRITIDKIDESDIVYGSLPALREHPVKDAEEGREAALQALNEAGVQPGAAAAAIDSIASGPGPGGSIMRGAMLIDARTGKRLEPKRDRGVRVSRLDVSPGMAKALREALARRGLEHFRTREALVLAAKVMHAPGVVAELCWSDDPDYTAGYVCAPSTGYLRLKHLKEAGDPRGGRAFFLTSGCSVAATIRFLEETPFMVDCLAKLDTSQPLEGTSE